jgi:hypothetical protein
MGGQHLTTIQDIRCRVIDVFCAWSVPSLYKTPWRLFERFSTLQFSISLIKLIGSFFSQRKFRVSVEGKMSTPRDIQAGVPQGSVLSPTLYSLYINDTPRTSGVYLGLFVGDTCIYATDRKRVKFLESCSEGSVLLRRGVSAGT